jgi:hypothetical protein
MRSVTAGEDPALAAEQMLVTLGAGLGRWIGAEGFRTLLDRTVREAVIDHPVLRRLGFLWNERGVVALVADQPLAEAAVASGMIAVVSGLIQLLGRIVGDEMALRLVERVGSPSSPEIDGPMQEGGIDA